MATVNGTTGNDTLNGTTGDDVINAYGGNDTINGGAGNDTAFGGAGGDTVNGDGGADTLYGGAGYDTLYGGDGSDEMHGDNDTYDDFYGGAGDDTIYAGDADDNYIYGGDDNDTIYGGDGFESIQGDAGDDVIEANGGADQVYGGTGNDSIDAGSGNDTVFGGDGNDVLRGGTGNDSVYGGIGSDTLYGGDGDDIIQGEQGDDLQYGGAGDDTFNISDGAADDTIFGGADDDTLSFVGLTDASVTFDGTGSATYTQNGGSTTGEFDEMERVVTQDGDDTIDGSSDSGGMTFETGAGSDTITGGSGNDSIDAGAGNDTITGGGGDDTIAGGTGEDVFVLSDDGGADVVTDFSIADGDSDGSYDDQIDVSDLIGGSGVGGAVRGFDVITTDVGGNALLTFPNGETLLLQGVTPAQMSSVAQYQAAGIPCFTQGTMIRTPKGDVAVETLKAGDLVCTLDNGPQRICWAGRKTLDRAALDLNPDLAPVHIEAGALGNSLPLRVSPQHGLLIRDDIGGGRERLVRAKHLAQMRGGQVRVARGVTQVTYVHLLFEAHQTVFSNGIASESFYPGEWGLRALGGAAAAEVEELFPDVPRLGVVTGYGATCRDFARRRHLDGHLNGVGRLMCA